VAVPGISQLFDRGRPIGGEVEATAALQVGQRLGSVAVADGFADLPVPGVVLADDGGELGVAADRLVDQLVPAAGADRLGLLGIPKGSPLGDFARVSG
jgi:hypothetical protein